MIAQTDKYAARLLARERIAALSESYIRESDEAIFTALLAHPRLIAARRLFAYYSVGREVSTHAVIKSCLEMGKTVALPVSLPGGVMYFADISGAALVDGKFGIPQPAPASEPVTALSDDFMLVPALCFDRDGFRLGRGGGYYDRYLAGTAAFTAGLCRRKLLVDSLPRLGHDIPVNTVLFEQ